MSDDAVDDAAEVMGRREDGGVFCVDGFHFASSVTESLLVADCCDMRGKKTMCMK